MRNENGLQRLDRLGLTQVPGSRDHVIDIINSFGFCATAVEVGTANGAFAFEILSKTKISLLSCVDPYMSYTDFSDALNFVDLEAMFQNARSYLSPFGSKVAFIRELSEPAATHFADASLDFVYVDGNHRSEYVTKDLNCWWPKIVKGGILFGDDCVDLDDTMRNDAGDIALVHTRKADGSPDSFGEYGVYHAVSAFAAAHDLGFRVMGTQVVIPK